MRKEWAIQTSIYTHLHTPYTSISTYTPTFTYIPILKFPQLHCTHTYIHTYIHKHIYTFTLSLYTYIVRYEKQLLYLKAVPVHCSISSSPSRLREEEAYILYILYIIIPLPLPFYPLGAVIPCLSMS